MNKISVLLVEDEQSLAMILRDTLNAQGFNMTVAGDGEEGLRLFEELQPDVLVADVMMPKMDGFEMVRRIRQHDKLTPVLFLTARSATDDVVHGFDLGANDYLRKPFAIQELIVRLRNLAGMKAQEAMADSTDEPRPKVETIGSYLFNPTTQILTYQGRDVELSHRESEILRRLCTKRNGVVETKDILIDLWGDDTFFNSRSLQVFITKLRHRLSKDEHVRIVNVRGIGYKLICP